MPSHLIKRLLPTTKPRGHQRAPYKKAQSQQVPPYKYLYIPAWQQPIYMFYIIYIFCCNQASILFSILRPICLIYPILSFRHRASPKILSPIIVLPDQGLLTQTFSCRNTSIALLKNILCKRKPYTKYNPRPSKMLWTSRTFTNNFINLELIPSQYLYLKVCRIEFIITSNHFFITSINPY